MKPLEEVFGSRTFRRIVLPGIVLTLGLHPVVSTLLGAFGYLYGVKDGAVILVVEVLFWGLLVSSAINPIYYVYEGFRLPWLSARARAANEKLVRSHEQELSKLRATGPYHSLEPRTQDRVSLLYEELQDFPLKQSATTAQPTHFVDRPTRLGNIIATYELYPASRYGIDGVFYWHHLLAFAPAPVVAEFNENYGFAESLLLTSFAGALVAIAHIAIIVGLTIGDLFPTYARVPITIGTAEALGLCAFGLLVGLMFYFLSLPAHRDAGKIFRAAVDLAAPQFMEWTGKVSPPSAEQKNRVSALHRYLDALQLSSRQVATVANSGSSRKLRVPLKVFLGLAWIVRAYRASKRGQ